MRLLKGMLLAMMLVLGLDAVAREVPIQDFFKDAEFTSVSISPDGRHMAVTVPLEDRTVLAVLRVADKGVVGKWDFGPDRHFRQVLWANDERLLFYVGFQTGRFDFETSKGDLYASNIDGTKRIAFGECGITLDPKDAAAFRATTFALLGVPMKTLDGSQFAGQYVYKHTVTVR